MTGFVIVLIFRQVSVITIFFYCQYEFRNVLGWRDILTTLLIYPTVLYFRHPMLMTVFECRPDYLVTVFRHLVKTFSKLLSLAVIFNGWKTIVSLLV